MNNNKKMILPSIFLFVILTSSTVVYAETITATQPAQTKVEEREVKRIEQAEKRQEQVVQKQAKTEESLKTRASNEIEKRIELLNMLITKISAMQKLSTPQKASFTTKVQTEITNLTTLKTKIAASTDTATLKADVQSIVTSFRIYALFVPQIHLLVAADRMSTAVDSFAALSTKLQAKITQAKTAGNDVTALETAYAAMQAKIINAKTQAQNVNTLVVALTPEGYPGNKTTLEQARALLKTGGQDLRVARKDAETIIKGLREMKILKTESTPSAAATNATTPATLR